MDCSIIIVNWNSAKYVDQCVRSIQENSAGIEYEILVVDNASYDGCEAIVQAKYPSVKFIQSNDNLGFARANNLGARYAMGTVFLFLNPDTELVDSALSDMMQALMSNTEVGCAGCRLVNADGSTQTSCIMPFPTLANQIFDIEVLKLKTPGLSLWGIKSLFSGNDKFQYVQAISGACLMVKRDVFKRVNGFSQDYFMYSEDIDLCYKIALAGFKSLFVNDATVVHYGGKSSEKSNIQNFSIICIKESMYIYFKKFHGSAKARTYRILILLVAIVRLGVLYFFMPFASFSKRRDLVLGIIKKWKTILKWALGISISKPIA